MSEHETTRTAQDGDEERTIGTGRSGGRSTPGSRVDDTHDEADDPPDVREELDTLRAENRRLREAYARSKRAEYRRTALALGALGVASVLGGVLFPIAREVLFVVGAVGCFAAVLTYFLTPERLVPETVERSIHDAVADTGDRLRAELGLQDDVVYVPAGGDARSVTDVRLFLPQSAAFDPAELVDTPLDSLFVLPDSPTERGVALQPTSVRLLDEFERAAPGGSSADVRERTSQLCDALVEQFELVDTADPEVDRENGRVTVAVRGGLTASATAFDHPVPSFVAAGLATGVGRPVEVESRRDGDRVLITCRWTS